VFSSMCDLSNGEGELAGGAQYMSATAKRLVLYIFCPKRQGDKNLTKHRAEGHCVDLQMLGRRMREDGRTKTRSAAVRIVCDLHNVQSTAFSKSGSYTVLRLRLAPGAYALKYFCGQGLLSSCTEQSPSS
jgi:hypothetical protein